MTEYPIGQRFTLRRKQHSQERTVIDIHKTYNHAGELVRTRYVTQHKVMGQPVTDYDVPRTTIAIALDREAKRIK